MHAWRGYETYAWGYDELCPLSQKGELAEARQLGGAWWQGAVAGAAAHVDLCFSFWGGFQHRWPLRSLLIVGRSVRAAASAALHRPSVPDARQAIPRVFAGKNDFGGLGATIIDSLDTLHMMGAQIMFADSAHCSSARARAAGTTLRQAQASWPGNQCRVLQAVRAERQSPVLCLRPACRPARGVWQGCGVGADADAPGSAL